MKTYDVIGIGNSLLDFTFKIDDSLLNEFFLKKGEMALINKEKSNLIFQRLSGYDSLISPGGSCSNTIAGIGILGGKTAFLGKLGKDSNAGLYEEQTKEFGVEPNFSRHINEITGHAITFITPDKERSFAVHLGASIFFRKQDIIEDLISHAKILHLEAYTLEEPELREASLYAIEIAMRNNVKLSLDLSDPSLIKRNLGFFRELIKNYVSIVFANEKEASAFTGKEFPEDALNELSRFSEIAIVKLGEKGSLIKSNGLIIKIPAYETNVVNTNGAGDSYAAGFLYGIVNDFSLEKSGNLASYVSSLVVGNESARLKKQDLEKINKFYFTKIL